MARIFDNIRTIARVKNIPIYELEKKAGVSTGSTYKWNSVSPTVRNLEKVATVLGCTIEELLESGEEKTNEDNN